ncbi:hypothetical protein P872_04540 [Rhodonellum psychrophilum GCM71 = DSM 17998]|uniref:Uncharacterized protein n=2 Tax=Rhodonellum TaxID=336827 RepID=U5BPT6_9BACT|nr:MULTISPECIES: hypothetical protein [Rhodonellum]ERM82585.1 hypothetical protein P872_04540 [Rhodonellum psychrophilum GCM71 = DSM 17998]SDZ53295.1 hypothetical protein SAMN05444412_12120 [Rhodonellum ikkaensis]
MNNHKISFELINSKEIELKHFWQKAFLGFPKTSMESMILMTGSKFQSKHPFWIKNQTLTDPTWSQRPNSKLGALCLPGMVPKSYLVGLAKGILLN